jgi:hypothetical protein
MSNESKKTAASTTSGKRPYATPIVKAHGNIRDITRSTGQGTAQDGSMTKSV